MSTIPNFNVVVQQANRALEVQNTQQHPVAPAQHAEARQPERETAQRTTVQESEEAEKSLVDRDGAGAGGGEPRNRRRKKREEEGAEEKRAAEDSGRLLDIVV